ncbi:hypothetical protein L873DRAFT_1820707 [Choiromyces venosus 120613-1]|uniref:Uncharacterized protein n=1 Tax=Choiromyces venosus 120613-1 TaxID=1336337 RepID=A0A3N4J0V7_9PEZI|nr:hypothetical protein L873DRAFT_1820707 [Choiromyces venosus 120613-1]
MNNDRYSPFSDRPLSRSSVGRSHSSSTFDRYGQRGNLTPDRYLSPGDWRSDWALRNNYEENQHTPSNRDHQLVPLPGKHLREAWGPHFSHQFSSYTDPEVEWSGGDEFDLEDGRYYQDERRREVYEWEHTTEPRIPRSGIQYVRSESVQRRYPHIMGYHTQYTIDRDLRERQGVGYGGGYGYVAGYERYMAGLGGREDLEAELARRRYLEGYSTRRRRYLR